MLWVVFVLVLLVVLALLLWPLLSRGKAEAARIDYDLVVYRDQLAEVGRDRERGLLDDEQAAAARTEIQRRMLAAEEAETFVSREVAEAGERRQRLVAVILVLALVPIGGALLYAYLGHPGLPGQPFAARQSDPAYRANALIAHIDQEMQKKPSAAGFRLLGDLLVGQRRFDDAAGAYQRAIQMGAQDAETLSSFGEALVLDNDGSVVPEARQAFLETLRADPKDARARFYLGLAESEIGENAKAVAIWKDLQADSPPDAPYMAMLKEHIATFAKEGGFDPASVKAAAPEIPPPGTAPPMMQKAPAAQSGVPTGALASAIAEAPPEQRQEMIRSMVAGLAAKLESDPGNLDGWLRLARAYKVLGEAEKAGTAKSRAAGLIAAMPAGSPERAEAQGRLEELGN